MAEVMELACIERTEHGEPFLGALDEAAAEECLSGCATGHHLAMSFHQPDDELDDDPVQALWRTENESRARRLAVRGSLPDRTDAVHPTVLVVC